MEILDNTLDTQLEAFFTRRLMAHLSTVGEGGARHAPLWFLWEDDAIWMIADRSQRTFPDRIERDPRCAIGIVDFDPDVGRLHHVSMRGRAKIEPLDPDRAERLLQRYFRAPKNEWNRDRFGAPQTWGEAFVFVKFDPSTVRARDQSYDVPAAQGQT